MRVHVDKEAVFELLDALMARWKAKPRQYPYNRPDATVPQDILPEDLHKDKRALACFYFYVCIYMRGGIESLQAFNALLRMRQAHPKIFDPLHAQFFTQEEAQAILKEFIGWDSKAAARNWVQNSQHLMRYWDGNPLNLIRGVTTYDEALRRIRNKKTKKDLQAAGVDGQGFLGFQHKMVSMLLYFYDWEKWLKPRFVYPSPADFHNFRLALASNVIVATHVPPKGIRNLEKISAPWREVVVQYMTERKADPVEVSDALWLFSLVMCGNSPLTQTQGAKEETDGKNENVLFREDDLPHFNGERQFLHGSYRKDLEMTCLRCFLVTQCNYAIPARAYYTRGLLVLRERPKIERHFGPIDLAKMGEPVVQASKTSSPSLFDD